MPDVETSSIQIDITAEDNASTTLDAIRKKLTSFAQALEQVQALWNAFSGDNSAVQGLESIANSIAKMDGASIKIDFSKTESEVKKTSTALAKVAEPLTKVTAETQKTADNVQRFGQAVNETKAPAEETANNVEKINESTEKAVQSGGQLTKIYDDVSEKSEEAKNEIQDLAGFMAKINEVQTDAIQKSISGLATKIGGILTPIGAATLALNAFGKLATTVFNALKTAVSVALNYLKGLFSTVIKMGGNFIKVVAKMTTALAKVSVYVGKTFGRVAIAPIQLMANTIGKVVTKLKDMFAGLVRIATYRLFRSMIKWITQGLSEGIENLYQWSKALDQAFSKAMDLYATDRQYLNNSFAAMLEPLIEQVIPILDQAVDKMVDLLNQFNQFFSAITGKSTWTKALKVATEYDDAAKDAKKSTDELKRSLLGFDEINRLDGDKNKDKSANKQEKDYSSMFEELPINSEIGDLAKKLRELINADQWFEAGQLLAEKLNGLLDMWDAESAGKIIAKKINNAVDIARGFITTANWRKLGQKFAATINNLLANLNGKNIGKLIADTLNGAINLALGFLETIDGDKIGKNLADLFNGFFNEIDTASLGKTISETLSKAFAIGISYFKNLDKDAFYNSILALIDNVDFKGLGNKLEELLNSIINVVDAGKISEILGKLIQSVADFVSNAVDGLDIAGLITKVIGIFTNLLTDGKTVEALSGAANTLLTKASEAISAIIANFPVSEIFTAIDTFVSSIDFDTIGANIGTALQTAIEKLNPNDIANAITTLIDKAVDLLSSFTEKMSEKVTLLTPDENGGVIAEEVTYWEALGAKLGWALANGLGNVNWEEAGSTLSKLFDGITKFIKTTIETADQNGELSNAIVTLINSIGWTDIVNDIIEILKNTKNALAEPLKTLGSAIASAIGDAIKNWFAENWLKVLESIVMMLNPATLIGMIYGKLTGKIVDKGLETYAGIYANASDAYSGWKSSTDRNQTPDMTQQQNAITSESAVQQQMNAPGGYANFNTPQEQTINVVAEVDGDVLFNSVVKTNNQQVRQTGQSPLYGR